MVEQRSRKIGDESGMYLAVGVLSVLKALCVRHNHRRLRRELTDAGLFLGAGLLIRRLGMHQKEGWVPARFHDQLRGRPGSSPKYKHVREMFPQDSDQPESLWELTRHLLGSEEDLQSLRERTQQEFSR